MMAEEMICTMNSGSSLQARWCEGYGSAACHLAAEISGSSAASERCCTHPAAHGREQVTSHPSGLIFGRE